MMYEATARGKWFDGQPVHEDQIIIPRKTMDLPMPILLDEKVQITISAIVTEVRHVVDKRTGRLIRKHVLELDAFYVEEQKL